MNILLISKKKNNIKLQISLNCTPKEQQINSIYCLIYLKVDDIVIYFLKMCKYSKKQYKKTIDIIKKLWYYIACKLIHISRI